MTTGEFSEAARNPNLQYIETIAAHADLLADSAQHGTLGVLVQAKAEALPEIGDFRDASNSEPGKVYLALARRPARGEPTQPRYQEVKKMEQVIGATIGAHSDAILELAVQTGMRRAEGTDEAYYQIIPDKAVFVAEGGANKTSIVRRGVAEKAMHAVYGDDLSGATLFQLGGTKVIDPVKGDGKPNAEYELLRGLAGDFLPAKGPFTQFDANLATALADGYEIAHHASDHVKPEGMPENLQNLFTINPAVKQVMVLTHPDTSRPQLVQVQSAGTGLKGGFDALAKVADLHDKQLVVATNGQYRPKDAGYAWEWARTNNIDMTPAVALGDEPGDEFQYKGKPMITPARAASAYVQELALYGAQVGAMVADEARNRRTEGSHAYIGEYQWPGSVVVYTRSGAEEVVEPDGSRWTLRSGNLQYDGPSDDVGMDINGF